MFRMAQDKHERPPWRMLAFAMLPLLVFVLVGCDIERPSWLGGMPDQQGSGNGEGGAGKEDAPPSAGDTIAEIGGCFVTYGCWALGISAIARIASFVFAILRPFSGIIDDAIIISASSIAVGSALVWVGLHSWVLWVVCLACLAAWIAYRRKAVVALWRKIVKGKP